MALTTLNVELAGLDLRSPLIAASGTVGSVWEWAGVADTSAYGAAVAKSVSDRPWAGRPAPRVAPLRVGMLNGIGIQNPGITAWLDEMAPRLMDCAVPVWGSAVGESVEEFANVAERLVTAGVSAVEVNLSCPNLDAGEIWSFDPEASASVIANVRSRVDRPVGAKLSPNTPDLVSVASSVHQAGADFVVLTNTALGFGVSLEGVPLLSGGVGGYSGPGLKPISLRCVYEVSTALPHLPIVGCGGISTGRDVVDYLRCGASAVEVGTAHFAEPNAGKRIIGELLEIMEALGVESPAELVGAAHG